MPEEVQKEVPPSYAVAQADSAPAYYETIVHTPSSGLDGEVLVDAMRELYYGLYLNMSDFHIAKLLAHYLRSHGPCLFLCLFNLLVSSLLISFTRTLSFHHTLAPFDILSADHMHPSMDLVLDLVSRLSSMHSSSAEGCHNPSTTSTITTSLGGKRRHPRPTKMYLRFSLISTALPLTPHRRIQTIRQS